MKINKFWKQQEKEVIIHNNKMNIIESCIDIQSKKNPDKIAFVFEDEKAKIKEYTYSELEKEVNKFANFLSGLNIKDSRIAVFLPKIPELYFSFLAIIKSGNIAVPLFEAFQEEGLELRLERGDINILITNSELEKRLKNKNKLKNLKHIIIVDKEEFKNKLKNQSDKFKTILKNRNSACLMIFTSSTSGTPVAGIEIPHQALIQQHYTGKLVLKLEKNSKYWCTAHPAWVTGSIYGILVPLSIGSTTYVIEGRFDAGLWINFLKKNKISNLYTAPTALRMLKEKIKKSDLIYLKNLASVGEFLNPSLYDFYRKLGVEIIDTYWQTETGSIVIANYGKIIKGSIGKAIPGITAEIIQGNIALKPDFPGLMKGIYKHEKMYQDYFKNSWFMTNDTAEKKGDYFFFIGRKDDIIKTSGERVSPLEIENTLLKHKAVKESAVIGIPDKIKGSIIKAFIVLNSEFQESEELKQELSLFVKQNYAGHSYPKIIQFIKELPKTNSGKIIRMKLREEK